MNCRLYQTGMKSRTAAQKVLLRTANKDKRLQFAQRHAGWIQQDWKKVIFTDDSTFTTCWDQKTRIYYRPEYVQRLAASRRTVLSVWGCIIKDGLAPLVRLEGKFTADKYCNILEQVALPHAANGASQPHDFVFQHDNFPVHTAKKFRSLLQRHQVEVMSWPPQSHDLNPIEDVSRIMKKALASQCLQGLSADRLWSAVKAEWERLKQDASFCESLYASLPSRMGGSGRGKR
ncbi:hypothetical protein MTO96_028294 [Rhipicephalus appendiculatus]